MAKNSVKCILVWTNRKHVLMQSERMSTWIRISGQGNGNWTISAYNALRGTDL